MMRAVTRISFLEYHQLINDDIAVEDKKLLLAQSLPFTIMINNISVSLGKTLGTNQNHAVVLNVIDRLSLLAEWM